MDEDSELVERVMAAMRQRLNDAVGSLREARTAVAFAEGERELAALLGALHVAGPEVQVPGDLHHSP